MAELQHPQPLSPLKPKALVLSVTCDESLPLLISVAASLDPVINDTLIWTAVRASSRASAVWESKTLAFSTLTGYHATVLMKQGTREKID